MPPGCYLLAALLAVASYRLFREREKSRALSRSLGERHAAQERAFGFIEGLGNHLQKNPSPAAMHRYVVDGLADALRCPGAALYLHDATRQELAPAAISPDCPLFLEFPSGFPETPPSPSERLNYLRLQTIPDSHPVYGDIVRRPGTLCVDDLAVHPAFAGPEGPAPWHHVSVLAAPLVHAEKTIGMALACRPTDGAGFSADDRTLFESLARQCAFALGSGMLHREAQEKRLLEAELRTASEFQRILFPARAPEFPGYTLAGANFPARIVSGDAFDYVPVDGEHLGVSIADVAGKGFPAALIMASCRSVLRTRAAGEASPAKVLSVVNRQIFPDIREDLFITLLYGILEAGTGRVLLARAGHRAALVFRAADRTLESLAPAGLAVGIDSGDVFDRVIRDQECVLASGDILLLYTDGVTEATAPDGQEYGSERLEATLRAHAADPVEAIVAAVCRSVREFTGDAPQSDDITLIAIKKG
jgi:sigma-B regulation protein RsbU (phosphoserine phosphatase)